MQQIIAKRKFQWAKGRTGNVQSWGMGLFASVTREHSSESAVAWGGYHPAGEIPAQLPSPEQQLSINIDQGQGLCQMDSPLTCLNKTSTSVINEELPSFPRLSPRFIPQGHLLSPRGVQGKPSPPSGGNRAHLVLHLILSFHSRAALQYRVWRPFLHPKKAYSCDGPTACSLVRERSTRWSMCSHSMSKCISKNLSRLSTKHFSKVRIIWLYIGSRKAQSQIPPAPKDVCNHVCHHLIKGMLH